nr:hypothetical protein CFP56_54842 [Quercus suber]
MAAPPHLSSNPTDPFQWRESVLSTRSISYVSTLDALGSPALPRSRNTSLSHARNPTRRTDLAEDGLEMDEGPGVRDGDDAGLRAIPEIPASVASSLLFTLPRELRDHIYRFCLTATAQTPIEWPPLPGSNARRVPQPQLLRTCRIIYEEASPVLYSSLSLAIYHPSDANMFVRAIASPVHSRHVAMLSLHIKAQDTRLWMPYLTSADGSRSLKADFPGLKELGVRYRSNKWHHASSSEHNMRAWAEDSRLDEIVDGLRHVFFPPPLGTGSGKGKTRQHSSRADHDVWEGRLGRLGGSIRDARDDSDTTSRRHTPDPHKIQGVDPAVIAYPDSPSIKVICACRIHPTLFAGITGTGPMPQLPVAPLAPPPPPPPFHGQQPIEIPSPPPPDPVTEGEPFRGFTIQDLRTDHVKRSVGEEVGTVKSARTPFTIRDGILMAFEVYTLESSKSSRGPDGAGPRGEHLMG